MNCIRAQHVCELVMMSNVQLRKRLSDLSIVFMTQLSRSYWILSGPLTGCSCNMQFYELNVYYDELLVVNRQPMTKE